MFSKSFTRRGNSILFGKNGIVGTSLKLGGALMKDGLDTPDTQRETKNSSVQEDIWTIAIFLVLGLLIVMCCS